METRAYHAPISGPASKSQASRGGSGNVISFIPKCSPPAMIPVMVKTFPNFGWLHLTNAHRKMVQSKKKSAT